MVRVGSKLTSDRNDAYEISIEKDLFVVNLVRLNCRKVSNIGGVTVVLASFV